MECQVFGTCQGGAVQFSTGRATGTRTVSHELPVLSDTRGGCMAARQRGRDYSCVTIWWLPIGRDGVSVRTKELAKARPTHGAIPGPCRMAGTRMLTDCQRSDDEYAN